MSLGRRYLAGMVAVTAAAAGGTLTVPEAMRADVEWGAAVGLLLQAPLGWWALRSIGTERFLAVWSLGTLVRLTVVGITGLAVVPALGSRAAWMLGSMVGVLVALLLLEGIVALREHSREDQR